MTIQDWGAVGEIVGAVAVIATLAYLALQIRYARAVAEDATRQSRAEGVREMLLATLANPEYRRAWTKADQDADSRMAHLAERLDVTKDEADLVWSAGCAWTYIHWAQFRAMKSKEDEKELRNLVSAFYSRAPMSVLWNQDPYIKALLDSDFVAWVDSILATPSDS